MTKIALGKQYGAVVKDELAAIEAASSVGTAEISSLLEISEILSNYIAAPS